VLVEWYLRQRVLLLCVALLDGAGGTLVHGALCSIAC
jgi:hypothetical protein